MKKYPTYKASKIQWIKEIPATWGEGKIKYLCQSIFTGATPSTTEESYWGGDIPWLPSGVCHDCNVVEAPKFITQEGYNNSSTKMIPENTTIIAITGATCSQLGYLTFPACANQSVVAFVENREKADSKFLFYYLLAARQEILTHQSGGAQGGINLNDCQNIEIPMIPLVEQQKISAFLDYKTSKIDRLVELLTARIDDLKKYRQSVISETVTRGLDKTAKLKNSGVEYGGIPLHWECLPMKRLMTIIRGGSPRPIEAFLTEGDGYNWIKIGDGTKGNKYITSTSQRILAEGLTSTRLVKPGDLILSNSMSFGHPYILQITGCIHDGWLALTNLTKVDKEYLYYVLLSDGCKHILARQADGGVVQNLNIDKVGVSPIPVPPLSEQQAIADYLDRKTKQIDDCIADTEKRIKDLQKYRTSLISEAVTGQIDVRDWEPKKL